MKILYINPFFNNGGSALACFEAVKYAKTLGHIVFTLGCKGGSMLSQFLELGQVKIVFANSFFDYYWADVEDVIFNFKPDLIHIWIPGHEDPKYFKNLPFHIPKVITVLCGQRVGFDHTVFKKVIFPSKYAMQLSPNVANGLVIRYGIGSQIHQIDPNELTNISPSTFGRISAFCRSKRILDTLECAKALRQAKFIIAGEVLDESYWADACILKQQNDLENVTLLRNITNSQKEIIYKHINCLHYPSTNEAFCLSILEGMKRGKAIISYEDSAIPELNHDNNLSLVKTNDIDELIKQTRLYFEDKTLIATRGQQNRQIYQKYYRDERYGQDLINVYTGILEKDNR